jgi:hypothetical protein
MAFLASSDNSGTGVEVASSSLEASMRGGGEEAVLMRSSLSLSEWAGMLISVCRGRTML